VTLFNHVRAGHALTLVEPTQFPERFPPLLYAVAMGDRALFVVQGLSRDVAETATVLDLADRPVVLLRGDAVGEEELRRAFKGMRFAADPIGRYDGVHLRDELDRWEAPPPDGPTRVPLDHAFPVKGVGAVALGIVRGGALEAHARLRLYPTEREVEVRSIQVHDVDVPAAAPGDRVGVALKGVEAEELTRGQVLAPPGALAVATTVDGSDLARCTYYRGTLAAGAHLQLAVGLQVVPARVDEAGPDRVRITADRPVALEPASVAFLADLSATGGSRLVARFRPRPA
jgi:selenocysteine-specific translation elongation factor